MEDYLEAIAFVERDKGDVHVSEIGKRLRVKMPSVSEAVRKLEQAGLVTHERYGHVNLTETGVRIAKDVMVRHEMLVSFLSGVLGLDEDTAEQDACKLEHSLSAKTRKRLSMYIEFVLDPKPPKSGWSPGSGQSGERDF